MKRIGILSSYNGSGYKVINDACKNDIIDGKVVVVISNNSRANVLNEAKKRETPSYVVNKNLFPNENLDKKITDILLKYDCDFIFLSGYMKKLESIILNTFDNKIINSHPSLLPSFGGKGMYGKNVHQAVVDAKETKSGVTIHYVNSDYDEGEYILQNSIKIENDDTVDTVEDKVKDLELKTIVEAFQKILNKN